MKPIRICSRLSRLPQTKRRSIRFCLSCEGMIGFALKHFLHASTGNLLTSKKTIVDHRARQKVSAVVISYNQSKLIETCLRALSFADEILLVDKSSTDGTPELGAPLVDRVISAPWSPVVEDTRALAVGECKYDWILCLDDDECLSVEAVRFIEQELVSPRAKIYGLPMRHYIIGKHDENAYYWPEYKRHLFRRDAVDIVGTVHGGMRLKTDSIYDIPADSGACIHHFSHASVSQWIEKTNRYTSRADRVKSPSSTQNLAEYAHSRIDEFVNKSKTTARDDYVTAVAVLRATYDIVDRLKAWETQAGLEGTQEFDRICVELNELYAVHLPKRDRPNEPDRSRFFRKISDYAKSVIRLKKPA